MKRISEMKKTLTIGIILTLFSTPAFAQSSPLGRLESIIPLILIFAVLYFIWKRQRKKSIEFSELLEQRFIDIENRIDSIERSQG